MATMLGLGVTESEMGVVMGGATGMMMNPVMLLLLRDNNEETTRNTRGRRWRVNSL
jgi:hypothetical protein